MKMRAGKSFSKVGRVIPEARRELGKAGFSMLEMIGVLAVMAILAAVIVPNALKSIDAAAQRAEVTNLQNLATSIEDYLRQNQILPTEENPATPVPNIPGWAAQLANFSGLSASDVAFNRRGQRRVYLIDPAAPRQRVIILSALENTLVAPNVNALPRQTDINTAARFESIWSTPDGSIPPLASWTGWAPWYARANGGSYLIIQRVHLQRIYTTDLKDLSATLNNQGTQPVYYRVIYSGSTNQTPPWTPLAPGVGASILMRAANGFPLKPKDRLELKNEAAATPAYTSLPDYRHTFRSTDVTFTFKEGVWSLQP